MVRSPTVIAIQPGHGSVPPRRMLTRASLSFRAWHTPLLPLALRCQAAHNRCSFGSARPHTRPRAAVVPCTLLSPFARAARTHAAANALAGPAFPRHASGSARPSFPHRAGGPASLRRRSAPSSSRPPAPCLTPPPPPSAPLPRRALPRHALCLVHPAVTVTRLMPCASAGRSPCVGVAAARPAPHQAARPTSNATMTAHYALSGDMPRAP